MRLEEYQKLVAALPHGKRLPTAVYVCREEGSDFGAELNQLIALLASRHAVTEQFNVIKFRTDELKVSFLSYPDFMETAHPALRHAITVDLVSGRARHGTERRPRKGRAAIFVVSPDTESGMERGGVRNQNDGSLNDANEEHLAAVR